MAVSYCVGVDLGGTNIKAGLLDADANIKSKFSVPTEVDLGTEKVIGNIGAAVKRAMDEAGVASSEVVGIGIGSPGPLSHNRGLVINPGNLPCLQNVPLRSAIEKHTGIKTTLENDANAAAWGEFWAGAGKEVNDLVMFTLGTGVGGGVISGGKLLRGFYENGAELGHIIVQSGGRRCSCDQHGCVEAYSSAYYLARRAEELVADGRQSSLKAHIDAGEMLMAEHIVEAAKAGDELARQVWDDACRYLATAIVTMQHVTNPELVVLAGGMIAAGDFLLDRVRKYFRELTWSLMEDFPDIRFATLGNDAGLIGAAGCAWQALKTGDW
ncbi:MAG: ROK family glucokinase [Planctomycetota bacterium]|nr:MAG: ROK family glucokinase [Planctomycetota bacterium]